MHAWLLTKIAPHNGLITGVRFYNANNFTSHSRGAPKLLA